VTTEGSCADTSGLPNPFIGSKLAFQLNLVQAGNIITWNTTNPTCSYQGAVTADGFTLSLVGGACTDVSQGILVCPNEDPRKLLNDRLAAETMTVTGSGNQATGTRTGRRDVLLAGTTTVVGSETTTESLALTR
jgi:hypothetical protein